MFIAKMCTSATNYFFYYNTKTFWFLALFAYESIRVMFILKLSWGSIYPSIITH